MSLDPAAALAAHVARTRFADLPLATVEATKRDLLDTLGCALGGSAAPGIDTLIRLHRAWGGKAESPLLLAGGGLPAPQAAFIHAAMAHALDYDDTYDRAGSIHPGASVFGAALATADLLGGVSGEELLLATTLGLDVSGRIALAATLDRGWHRTSAIGVFGAAAVAGKLLGLTQEQLHQAFGIALSQAAGSRQCILDGALTKRFQAGQAASAGIISALLAKDGFTGAIEVFAGRYGFFELYQPDGFDLAPLTEALGQAWRGDEVSFKPYPCARPMHAAIDAALILHRDLGLAALAGTSAIAAVVVEAPGRVIRDFLLDSPARRAPRQIVEAQFALPFLVAAALRHGRLGIDEVAGFDDPEVLGLASRIEGAATEGPSAVRIKLQDGRTARVQIDLALGSPGNPLSPTLQAAKFHDNAVHALRHLTTDEENATIDAMLRLEKLGDARQAWSTLTENAAVNGAGT